MENELHWYRRLGLNLSSELCDLRQSLYLLEPRFFILYETGNI